VLDLTRPFHLPMKNMPFWDGLHKAKIFFSQIRENTKNNAQTTDFQIIFFSQQTIQMYYFLKY